MPAQDDPRPAGWLAVGDNCLPLGYEIVLRALCDLGICEQPEGSNRGGRIDAMCKRLGIEPPAYWCAIWVCCVLADRGCHFPLMGADCDQWLPYVHLARLADILHASAAAQRAMIGSQILYGTRGTGTPSESASAPALKRQGWDAVHIGIIARITATRVFTIEGNRGYAGGVTNNGEWVGMEPVNRNDVIGVVPFRAIEPPYTPKLHRIPVLA